jgi:hypothetical protein
MKLMYVVQGKFAVRHDAAALRAGHSVATIRRALTPPPDLSGKPLKQWNSIVYRKARIAALDRSAADRLDAAACATIAS